MIDAKISIKKNKTKTAELFQLSWKKQISWPMYYLKLTVLWKSNGINYNKYKTFEIGFLRLGNLFSCISFAFNPGVGKLKINW